MFSAKTQFICSCELCIWPVQNSSACSSCSSPGCIFSLVWTLFHEPGERCLVKPRHYQTMSRLRTGGQVPLQEPGRGVALDDFELCLCWLLCLISYLGIKRGLLSGKHNHSMIFSKRPWSDQIFLPLISRRKWGHFFHHISEAGGSGIMWINVWTDIFWEVINFHTLTDGWHTCFPGVSAQKAIWPFHLYRISVSDFAPFLETMFEIKQAPGNIKYR